MRITYLLTQSLDSPSGLGRYGPLASQMVKLRHEVNLFALHPDLESLSNTIVDREGLTVNYVAPMHVRKAGSQKTYYSPLGLIRVTASATWQLTRAALQTPADIIHICKPHPMNGIAGLFAHYFRKAAIVLDCDDYEAGSGFFERGWQKSGVAYFEKNLPRKVNLITTNTYYMRDKLRSWGVPADNIFYLPNGVDRKRFKEPDMGTVQGLRQDLRLGANPVIVYTGSMSLASHAVDLLLGAFEVLKVDRPDAILLLVGGGEDYTHLRSLAQTSDFSQDIKFTGRVPPDNVPDYYRLADVSIDPVYDNEAARGRCPLKLFESWACGVPFVTADVGDRSLIIGDPPAGLLSEPGDARSLANSILQILNDGDLAQEIRQRGLQRVAEYYWDVLGEHMDTIYHAVLDQENS